MRLFQPVNALEINFFGRIVYATSQAPWRISKKIAIRFEQQHRLGC
jgi:hypothetical protein